MQNTQYNNPVHVDASSYDAVSSFFMRITNDANAAKSLTESILVASKDLNVDVMELLDEFKDSTELEVTALMIALINRTRRNTSTLGLKQPQQTNKYVARNILS